MRLYSFVSAAALLTSSLAAHADTLTVTFTANGNATSLGPSFVVDSSSFGQFNPALGTLNSVNITLTGTAVYDGSGNTDRFSYIGPAQNPGNYFVTGSGSTETANGAFTSPRMQVTPALTSIPTWRAPVKSNSVFSSHNRQPPPVSPAK